jgi:hypothetical protein
MSLEVDISNSLVQARKTMDEEMLEHVNGHESDDMEYTDAPRYVDPFLSTDLNETSIREILNPT